MKKTLCFCLMAAALGFGMISCNNTAKQEADKLTASGLCAENFATDSTALYVLTNTNGMEVCFTNFGGRIVSIMVPDKDGNMQDVCLGHDNIQDYEKYGAEGCNFGALAGLSGSLVEVTYFRVSSNVTDKHYFIQ